MSILLTGPGIQFAQLAALKGAVKLELLGMKHSSGKSMRKVACAKLGIKTGTKHMAVIKALEAKMQELLPNNLKRQAE